jgi:hypothetical protein
VSKTQQSGPGAPIGPRPTMPPATNVPDDRTGASTPSGFPHAAPPPHRASSHRWWWLVAAGALLLLVAGGGLTRWGQGGTFAGSTDQQRTYRGDFTALDFTGSSGNVQVSAGAAAGTIEVTRHLRWGMGQGQPTPDEQVRGGTLAIDSRCGGGFMSMCSIDYQLRVPDGTQVSLGVGSGDLALSGALGVVKAETGSGNVDANNLTASDTTLRTGSGDVDLSFTTAPSKVDLRTGSGNVEMFVPKGESYAVDVNTGSGDKNVKVDTSQSSPRTVHVETGSGNVDVAYR